MAVSKDPKFWEAVIDEFYNKYVDIRQQHKAWMEEAMLTGQLVMPTGRIYKYQPYRNKWSGELVWPRTTILNYPVQGLGADIVSVLRVSLYKRLNALSRRSDILLVSSVHDSIVIDTQSELVDEIASVVQQCFTDLPANISRCFDVKFNLPLSGEMMVGPNLKDMKAYEILDNP